MFAAPDLSPHHPVASSEYCGTLHTLDGIYSARQQKIAIAQLRSWPEKQNFNEIAPIAVFTHVISCERKKLGYMELGRSKEIPKTYQNLDYL